jgi:SAM-dependent methyltransferase
VRAPSGEPSFERYAWCYDALARPFSAPLLWLALREMRPLAVGTRILDLGCGPGAELSSLARLAGVARVVGVDSSPAMVRRARRTAPARVEVLVADAAALPTRASGPFDLVITVLAHHHFDDPYAVAGQARRVLARGGVYAVVDSAPGSLDGFLGPLSRIADPGFVGHLPPEELADVMLRAGFDRVVWRRIAPGVGCALGHVDPG